MGKQRQKKFCGQCSNCLVKADCGKCIFCVNKKTWRKKCELRRCQVYEKTSTSANNVKNCEVKWTFTLQLSNKLIEACYNQEYGTPTHISGTIYEDTTIYRDNEKITIELEDSSNIVYTKTIAGKAHHHSVVDIAFTDDSWTTRNDKKPRPVEIVTNTSIKLQSVDDLNYGNVSHTPQDGAKIEDNDDLEGETTETMLVNFTDETFSPIEVQKEQSHSFNTENFTGAKSEHCSNSRNQVLRPRRKSFKPRMYKEESDSNAEEENSDTGFKIDTASVTGAKSEHCSNNRNQVFRPRRKSFKPRMFKEESDSNAEEENSDNGFKIGTGSVTGAKSEHCSNNRNQVLRPRRKSLKPRMYKEESNSNAEEQSSDNSFKIGTGSSKKKLHNKVKVKCEPDTMENSELSSHTEACELPETNDETDEYTVSSEVEFETDIDNWKESVKNRGRKADSECCGFKSNDRDTLMEHTRMCKNLQRIYMIKIKCPVCKILYKYSRTGIIRHIRVSHKEEDAQFSFQQNFKQNMIDWAEVKDEMMCEFCNRNMSKASYPLHIQWEHSEQNLENCQDSLANYFASVMTVDEFICKITAKKNCSMTLAVEKSLECGRSMYEIKIECPLCHIKFQYNEAGVLKHIEECHSDVDNKLELFTEMKHNMIDLSNLEEQLSCEFCEKACSKVFLPLHIQWEHSERNFEKSQDMLATYFTTIMSTDELECESILKDYDMTVAVQENRTVNLETSTCEYCNKIVYQRKMSKHHKSCHVYQCKCGFRSPEKTVIKEHKSRCKKITAFYVFRVLCPVCRNSYKYSKGSIIRHLRDHHKDEQNQVDLIEKLTKNIANWESTDDKTLSCEFCDVKCSKIFYPFHVQWEHSDRNVERSQNILCNYFENVMTVNEFNSVEMYKNSDVFLNVVEKCRKSSDKGTCEHCGKVADRKRLVTHRKKCTKNPQRKFFYCECGFKCPKMSFIKEHKRTCKREPFVCDICGKKMKSKSHYFSHRKYDHGIVSARGTAIKKYPCEDCDKVFHLPGKLKVHRLRRHSDEKNFICEFCSSAYKFATALKNHIQFAHNNIYKYYCEKCGHGMNKKAFVKKHVCGRTRRRLKQHEKWMKNLIDKDQVNQANPSRFKRINRCGKDNKSNDLVNSENEGTKYKANQELQESSEQHFSASSEIHEQYGSLSSVEMNQHNIDITTQINLRQPVNQTEHMIFPMQSAYTSLQPSVLSGYHYPSFISDNKTLPSSSDTSMSNYHDT